MLTIFKPEDNLRQQQSTHQTLTMSYFTLPTMPAAFLMDELLTPSNSPFFAASIPSLENNETDRNCSLDKYSPSCCIKDNEDKYEIAIDVPGIKANDIKVQVEQGGRILRLSGERKSRHDNTVTEYTFERQFTLSNDIDASKVEANINDGVLVVTLLKDEARHVVKSVPVTMGSKVKH